jgi:purine-binding chemotaxis protein CheW
MSAVHVRVRAAGEDYALPISSVLEVADLGEVTPLPGAPAGILGVRNLRGQVLPVIDLASVLGLAGGSPERIVVTEEVDRRAALAVDSVVDVAVIAAPTAETESDYLNGATLVDGDLVGLVDVRAMLDAVGASEDT